MKQEERTAIRDFANRKIGVRARGWNTWRKEHSSWAERNGDARSLTTAITKQLREDVCALDAELTRVEVERDNALEILRSMEHGAQGIYEDAKLRAAEKLRHL